MWSTASGVSRHKSSPLQKRWFHICDHRASLRNVECERLRGDWNVKSRKPEQTLNVRCLRLRRQPLCQLMYRFVAMDLKCCIVSYDVINKKKKKSTRVCVCEGDGTAEQF